MIKVGVVGGTGYTGVELLRLLAAHPQVQVAAITSRAEAGVKVADHFPSLRGRYDLAFTDPAAAPLKGCDCVFFATPNGVAMGQARALLESGSRIVDFSADFRLKDRAVWEKWYKVPHASPELLAEAVYGLPEVNRERIRKARLVANPGCYATAVQLALLPLVETQFVDHGHLIADAKSGVSGAGRKTEADLLFSEASDNFKAYAVKGHRHHPEIIESLASLEGVSGRRLGLTFVPHLVPPPIPISRRSSSGAMRRSPSSTCSRPARSPRRAGCAARTSAASPCTGPSTRTRSSSSPWRTTW